MMLTIYGGKISSSLKSAIKDIVPLKYNRLTDSSNGLKCATVQLHPLWHTDLSGESPKSGQFCTQGKWTTLAQTDLISVWFTTFNHLMSHCHVHIINSFVFLSQNYNKSVEKGNYFEFKRFSSLLSVHSRSLMAMKWGDRETAKINLIVLHQTLPHN